MARETITRLIDDLDGTDADETVSFALDGRLYRIDLNEDNASVLREVLASYVGAAEPCGNVRTDVAQVLSGARRGRRNGRRTQSVPRSSDARLIREWAAENGLHVSHRGRIPFELRAKYEAAVA